MLHNYNILSVYFGISDAILHSIYIVTQYSCMILQVIMQTLMFRPLYNGRNITDNSGSINVY